MNESGIVLWLKQLDRLLRGEVTRLADLKNGTLNISAGGLSLVIQVLGVIYGVCMACYALFSSAHSDKLFQLFATMLKVPLLVFLTLLVTFPSLYVFNTLVGSRLSLQSTLRLLIASIAVMMTVLASFGPIVAFFSASTTSYPFMLLLNVVVWTVAGFLGLKFLLFTLHRLSIAQKEAEAGISGRQETVGRRLETVAATSPPLSTSNGQPAMYQPPAGTASQTVASQTATATITAPPPSPVGPPGAHGPMPGPHGAQQARSALPQRVPGALDRDERPFGSDVTTIFRIWVVVFGLVGAQMSWVLRPFVGSPGAEFAWLRARDSNFFEAVFRAISSLVGG